MEDQKADETPKIVIEREDDGRTTRVELMVGGKGVSRLWLTPFTLRIGRARVPMVGVGGVGTDDAYRNRGFSRRVLEAALQHMLAGDAALTMLYGIRDFYPKFGYATAGPDHLVLLTDLERDSTLPAGWSVRQFASADLEQVRRLYERSLDRRIGAAERDPRGEVWARLRKTTGAKSTDGCRVAVAPNGEIGGYAWRASWCWYVRDTLESNYPNALVIGEAIAEGPGASDAVLAAFRQWAREPHRRKVSEVLLAMPPDDPIAAAAMYQDARLIRSFAACGGSMARVLNVDRLVKALQPELEARLQAWQPADRQRLVIRTEPGQSGLLVENSTVSVWDGRRSESGGAETALPQQTLARLALGAFPPEDLLSRLNSPLPAETAALVCALFPLRHPHMSLPDRY